MIDGQIVRAHHKASEATSGSEGGAGGWVAEWAAKGWGDKGLVCKCNALTFQSLEEKNSTCSKKKKKKKKVFFKSKQNSIGRETAAVEMMMPATDTIIVFQHTLENLMNVSPRKQKTQNPSRALIKPLKTKSQVNILRCMKMILFSSAKL